MRFAPFKLERFFAAYEFQVRHLLCASDCESLSIRELLDQAPGSAEGLLNLHLGYTEAPGHPELRAAVAATYQGIEPAEILVHTGAEEAILGFGLAVLRPGDQVLVHAPCYQSLASIALGNGCEVVPWRADPEQGWALDPDDLPRLATPKTRAIVLNTPHNPTGHHLDRARFDAVVRFAAQRGLLLFCDEVYRGLEQAPADRLPAACEVYENAVSLGVMSKAYGLAGLRIGWVATRNREVRERMAGFKDYASICASGPSEYLATVALRQGEALIARNRAIIAENLVLLDAFFARQADTLRWTRPKAGPIAFPRLLGHKGERGATAFCQTLLDASGVLLAPAPLFDAGDAHFRLGFGRRRLPEALAAFETFLQQG
jgi:aspartate/methionine/tyrosine aminotransferase